MRRLLFDAAVALLIVQLPFSFAVGQVRNDPPVAFRHVTLISGDRSAPVRDATVITRRGRIQTVGPSASTRIPRGTRIVDGRGRFLIPGLWDMHVHISKTRASALGLFVANGVTSVRDAGGDHEELLRWRREIAARRRVGPRMVIAGPYLESVRNVTRMRNTPVAEMAEPVERTRVPIGSAEDAQRVVDSVSALEVDFLKIRTAAHPETYQAIGDAARRNKRRLTGHAFGFTPEQVVSAGQTVVDHYMYPTLEDRTRDQRLEAFRALAQAGVVVVPTLVAWFGSEGLPDSIVRTALDDSLKGTDPRRHYVSRYLALDWREQYSERDTSRLATLRKLQDRVLRNFREMREAGVRMLAGSDVAVLRIFPGFSLHDELEHLVTQLAMTPVEALASATTLPAELFGFSDSLGTIAPGKIADLVLLDADPLANIANTRQISGVMLRGRYFDRRGLDALLRSVQRAPDRKVNDWPRQR
ncbi:MAG: amidohydrolase family protein [Gemmatimonadaceae bacterium]